MGLSPTQFLTIVDNRTHGYLKELGTVGSGYGIGDSSLALASDWGASLTARNLLNYCQSLLDASSNPDYSLTAPLSKAASDVATNKGWKSRVFKETERKFLNALGGVVKDAGLGATVVGLDSFCGYYNTGAGGPYTCLLPPDFRDLYYLIYSAYPTAANVYPNAITNMAQQTAGGAFAAGTAVDSTKYAGAAILNAVVPAYTGAGGTITVTGTVRKADGTTAAARTFTGTIPTNGGTTVALTPTVAGDKMITVSGITLPGGVTAGVVVVIACAIPAGRTDPP